MSQPSFIDDAERGVLDTLTPLPVLPVSSKAVIQDVAVGLAAQSGKKESEQDIILSNARKERDASSSNKPKRNASRRIKCQLWFNTYRRVGFLRCS